MELNAHVHVRAMWSVRLEPGQQIDVTDLGNRAPARITGVTFEWDGGSLRAHHVISYRIKKDGTVGTAPGGVWDFKVTPELFDPAIVTAAKQAIREALIAAGEKL